MSMNIFSVATALSTMEVKADSLKFLTEENSIWDMFGKKDSHLLRAKLFKLMKEAKLSNEERFMVFFFFAVIKNKKRVMESFDQLPEEIRALTSVVKAKQFINDTLVQYTSQETNKKFAVVHLPTTMPGLDILLTAFILDDKEESLTNAICTKQTFAQINIDSSLQAINKTAQQLFWDTMVKKSKNEARINKTVTDDLKFHEDYYETSAKDKYNLVNIKFKEIKPKDEKVGYSKEELLSWFKEVKKEQANMIKSVKPKEASTSSTT